MAADIVASGLPVHPEDRVRLFSPDQWERFIQEWVDSLRDEYDLVERCGGAGDMGRDVIATVKSGNGAWDNYQCKHYRNALAPSAVWVELGKLAYYTLRGEYSYPRSYFFVAPQGVGPALSNLLKKPHALRDGLLANWDKACRTEITKTEVVECDAKMKAHIASLDFSIFQTKPLLRIIEAHAKTPWYVARFGGGLPMRPEPMLPPSDPADNEAVFVGELRRAYADHLAQDMDALDAALGARGDLLEHFHDARVEFYSAEGLRTFSRDRLPAGEFEKLQDEVHSGIRDDVRGGHADGYGRVVAAVKTARALQLTNNPLTTRIHTRDRGGICHQLVNDGKVRWVK
ncbi:MAG: ABC-three component system protein [Lysobacterales bacterium]